MEQMPDFWFGPNLCYSFTLSLNKKQSRILRILSTCYYCFLTCVHLPVRASRLKLDQDVRRQDELQTGRLASVDDLKCEVKTKTETQES